MRQPTQVPRHSPRARDLWVTVELTVPTVVALALVELAQIGGLILGWLR